jgi:hypothetical protein
MKKLLVLMLLVLTCTLAFAQNDYVDSAGNVYNNWRLDGYAEWKTMTVGERHAYCTGIMVGSYSFGLRYVLRPDVQAMAGKVPAIDEALIIGYTNSDLVRLVNRMYAIDKYRNLKLPEIICWPEVWIKILSAGGT